MIRVTPYQPAHRGLWNRLNSEARNGHFMFDRGFMEYHSDRFTDASAIFWEDDRAIAVMPANAVPPVCYSHQGLTFGGLVLSEQCVTRRVIEAFAEMLTHLSAAVSRG